MKTDKHKEPQEPYGILSLLDPRFEHLLDAEARFDRAVNRAIDQGRLYIPEPMTLQ